MLHMNIEKISSAEYVVKPDCFFVSISGVCCVLYRDFVQFHDKKYGNCYTFNSGMDGTISKVTNPGSSFGKY